MGKEWDEKLFGCFANIPVCLIAGCLPGGFCMVQAAAVDKATKGESGKLVPCLLVCALDFIGGALNRERIRKEFNIEGTIVNSLLIWLCCGPCASCQEYREAHGKGTS